MVCNALHNADVMQQKRIEENRKEILTYQLIVDMLNEICVSFPRVTAISNETIQQETKNEYFKMFAQIAF